MECNLLTWRPDLMQCMLSWTCELFVLQGSSELAATDRISGCYKLAGRPLNPCRAGSYKSAHHCITDQYPRQESTAYSKQHWQEHLQKAKQASAMSSSPKYKLMYYPARGRAELIRFLFAHLEIPYEDVRIPFEEWPKMKPGTQCFLCWRMH